MDTDDNTNVNDDKQFSPEGIQQLQIPNAKYDHLTPITPYSKSKKTVIPSSDKRSCPLKGERDSETESQKIVEPTTLTLDQWPMSDYEWTNLNEINVFTVESDGHFAQTYSTIAASLIMEYYPKLIDSESNLLDFIHGIFSKYNTENQYHNQLHALDLCITMIQMFQGLPMLSSMIPEPYQLLMVFTLAGIDTDHRARPNSDEWGIYEQKTEKEGKRDLDRPSLSPNETRSMKVLLETIDRFSILSGLRGDTFDNTTEMEILIQHWMVCTDPDRHTQLSLTLSALIQTFSTKERNAENMKPYLCEFGAIIIHCVDIMKTARSTHYATQWRRALAQETCGNISQKIEAIDFRSDTLDYMNDIAQYMRNCFLFIDDTIHLKQFNKNMFDFRWTIRYKDIGAPQFPSKFDLGNYEWTHLIWNKAQNVFKPKTNEFNREYADAIKEIWNKWPKIDGCVDAQQIVDCVLSTIDYYVNFDKRVEVCGFKEAKLSNSISQLMLRKLRQCKHKNTKVKGKKTKK